jgi:hypothetical protein
MNNASDLSIEQQKLIFETVLMLVTALELLANHCQTSPIRLQKRLSWTAKERISEFSENYIREAVKEFFDVNVNQSDERSA